MNSGRLVFSQVMDFLPRKVFDRCVSKYSGNSNIQHFTCRSQFYCMPSVSSLTGMASGT